VDLIKTKKIINRRIDELIDRYWQESKSFNQYNNFIDQELQEYLENNQETQFDPDFLKFLRRRYDFITNRLKYNNSNTDKIICEIINSVEDRWVLPMIKDHWEQGLGDPEYFYNFEKFKYTIKRKKIKKRGKSKRTLKRYLLVWELFKETNEKHDSWTRKEIYKVTKTPYYQSHKHPHIPSHLRPQSFFLIIRCR